MFKEEVLTVSNAAVLKTAFLKKRPFAYFLLSMLAGIFVGLGILLIATIGGLLGDFAGAKIIMGASFGIALSLVIMAGSELFTGNNFVMTVGMYYKKVTPLDTLKLWIVCWVGNLTGSILVAILFFYTGLANGPAGQLIANLSAAKMALPIGELIFRGILCNLLVCLAVWCGIKMKSESGKLIMIFWCLFAFITTGFEHSVANMSLLAVGILNPMGQDITVLGYFYNLLFVTLGNIISGAFLVGLPYSIIAGREEASHGIHPKQQ